METPQARPRFGFWHGVGAAVVALLVIIVVFGALLPIFSRARRAAHVPMIGSDAGGEYGGATAPSPPQDAGYRAGGDESKAASWANSIVLAASRMLIKTADLNIEVKDAKKTHAEIAGIASKAGGFVTGSSLSGEEGSASGMVTIRVPAARYASVLAEVSKLGKVLSKQEKGEDVTEEYVDLQSRIRNLKREEEAFLGVLLKARSVSDILRVESELSRVRGEIEQGEGRAKYLQNQVALSTINVSFSEPTPVVTRAVQWNVVQTVLRALHALGGVFRALASLLIWLVVFIPLWAFIWLVIRGWKRLRARRAAG